MIEFLIAFLIVFFASFLPGFHINTLALLFSSLGFSDQALFFMVGLYLGFSLLPILFYRVGLDIASVPAIQKLMNKNANKAVSSYIFGILFGSIFALILPLNIFELYFILKPYLVLLILFFVIIAFRNNLASIIFFLIFGFIGFISLSFHHNFLFSIFCGAYAIPFIFFSSSSESKLSISLKPNLNYIAISFLGSLLGALGLMLPGISSASVLASLFFGLLKNDSYIALTSSIIASQYILSIKNFMITGKSRLGFLTYVKAVHLNSIFFVFAGILLSITLLIYLLKNISTSIINTKLKLFLLLYLLIFSFYFDGFFGFLLLILSTITSLIGKKFNFSLISPLGAIIIPTLYFLIK